MSNQLLEPDEFSSFFVNLIKEINYFIVDLINSEKYDQAIQILIQCEQWTLPGLYGAFPTLRILIFNNFGCLHKKKKDLTRAYNYLRKALKIGSSVKNLEFQALSHMNISAVLSELGEYIK